MTTNTMTLRVTLTIKVDRDAWELAYSTPGNQVGDEIRESVPSHYVHEGLKSALEPLEWFSGVNVESYEVVPQC